MTSANAITCEGEIVNIDGRGNRVAATIFGPPVIIAVTGVNKITDSLEDAIKGFAMSLRPKIASG